MLYIKKSVIPGAGLGLKTSKSIKRGEKIVEYKGRIYSWEKCLNRAYDQDKEGYVFYINKDVCIDTYDFPENLARYVNDAEGYNRIKGLENNSEYSIEGKKVFIVATKDIKPHSEIFAPYGKDYWEDFDPDDDED